MVNFRRFRKVAPQIVEVGIRWRNSIRVEARSLDFAVPLITNQVIRGRERERNQSQNYRDAPECNRLSAKTELRCKMRNGRNKNDAGGKCGSNESDRHLFKRPIVKKIQCSDEANLGRNEDRES